MLIASDTFPPDINGAARFTERLAGGLVRNGNDVHVIAPSFNKTWGTSKEVIDSVSMTVHRIRSYKVPFHKTLRYVNPFTLKRKGFFFVSTKESNKNVIFRTILQNQDIRRISFLKDISCFLFWQYIRGCLQLTT